MQALNKIISQQKNKLTKQSKKINGLRNITTGKFNGFYLKVGFLEFLFSGKSRNCKEIKDFDQSLPTGTYKIEIDGEILNVRCEMNSASGVWTVSFLEKYLVIILSYLLVYVYIYQKRKLCNFKRNIG